MKYFDLGADKQLNEIVFAGSHDAAITSGSRNEKTQDLDIAQQAEAGVRLFDLRIGAAAGSGKVGGVKTAELKAYHGSLKHEDKTRYIGGQAQVIDRNKLSYGTWGLGLEGMLADARRFVSGKYSEEFLILKFDKCSNWELIAEACVRVLGNTIYRGTGNLNLKTLRDLAGKVIVLFTAEGLQAISAGYKNGGGISGIRSLYSSDGPAKDYNPNYDGLQYYGKGGTSVSPLKAFHKVQQNKSKQTKLMSAGAAGDANVMGMMYWTSTGLFESIRDRNDTMWTGSNVSALRRMWKQGLHESIQSRLAHDIDPTAYAFGNVLKAFMPNIVMIDFADTAKCRTIYELNHVAATSLTQASVALDAEVKNLQANYAQLLQRRGGV